MGTAEWAGSRGSRALGGQGARRESGVPRGWSGVEEGEPASAAPGATRVGPPDPAGLQHLPPRDQPRRSGPIAAFPSAAAGDLFKLFFFLFFFPPLFFFSGAAGAEPPAAGAPQPGMCEAAGTAGGHTQLFSLLVFFFVNYSFSPSPVFFRGREGTRLQPPRKMSP